MIPVLGIGTFTFSIYDSARLVQAAAISIGRTPAILDLRIFLLPHAWIELTAYAVALLEGLFISKFPLAKSHAKFLGKHVLASAILVALILLVAAAFEVGEEVLSGYSLLAWIPFAAIALAVFMFRRHFAFGAATSTPHA